MGRLRLASTFSPMRSRNFISFALAATSLVAAADLSFQDSVATSTSGPLRKGDWGVGLRTTFSDHDGTFTLRRAITASVDVGIGVDWSGSYTEEETKQAGASSRRMNGTVRSIGLEIPAEMLFACRGEVCLSGQIGPSLEVSMQENLDEGTDFLPTEAVETPSWSLGMKASTGIRWFFRQNLAFAADYGFDLAYTRSERRATQTYSYDGSKVRYSYTTWSARTSSAFLGFGLDAWF